MKSIRAAKSNYQERIIIERGTAQERHFVRDEMAGLNQWAVPGFSVVGIEIIQGSAVRVFCHKRATTKQIRAWAESRNLKFEIDKRYPVYFAEVANNG